MENGKREAAMQLPTRPIKANPGFAERTQENVINHVG
jgi:hypothetical protein